MTRKMAIEVLHIYIFEDCIYTTNREITAGCNTRCSPILSMRRCHDVVNQGSKVQSPVSPVCQMRLSAVALSLYELSCWWDILNTKTQQPIYIGYRNGSSCSLLTLMKKNAKEMTHR